eukprot:gene139-32853_t
MISVQGAVTWVDPYKGGARPPPDIEAEGRRTKPCTNAVLHVRSAADADFDLDAPAIELKTDADGAFAVELEPGLYNVFRAAKYGKPAWHGESKDKTASPWGGGMDAGENTAWRRRPDCTFEVKDGMLEQCGVQLHWAISNNFLRCGHGKGKFAKIPTIVSKTINAVGPSFRTLPSCLDYFGFTPEAIKAMYEAEK